MTTDAFFQPLVFDTFGHAEHLGVVIADDIGSLFTLTSKFDVALEQTTLAFCPTLTCLEANDHPNFTTIDSVLSPANEASLRERPLCSLTKLKLNGFCSLAGGMQMQLGVFRQLVKPISAVLAKLQTSQQLPGRVEETRCSQSLT